MNRDAICVLGAGSWGTALAIRLATNNNTTCLWGHEPAFVRTLAAERQNRAFLPGIPFPTNLDMEEDLARAVQPAREILIVVPSHAFRDVLSKVAPLLDQGTRIAWATKGLEQGSGMFMSDVLEEVPDGCLEQPGLCQ
jgi:glycerol-3-phosphate dehydrogenase (NAD(P)+)